MIDWIHESAGRISGIVINPRRLDPHLGGPRRRLVVPGVPILEVHISNVHKREAFRHHSYVSPIAAGVIAGYGIRGYEFAIRRLAEIVG